jgi:hypothetical protein
MDDLGSSVSTQSEWNLCGRKVTRTAAVFICQIFILYVAIVTCFINLSLKNGPNELWITVLSLSLGSILPSPKVRKKNAHTPAAVNSSGTRKRLGEESNEPLAGGEEGR